MEMRRAVADKVPEKQADEGAEVPWLQVRQVFPQQRHNLRALVRGEHPKHRRVGAPRSQHTEKLVRAVAHTCQKPPAQAPRSLRCQ